jgi:nucleoside 2-deoxyribosyltransferase
MGGRSPDQVKAERDQAADLFKKNGIMAVDPGAAENKLWRKGKRARIGLKFPKPIIEAFVKEDKWLIRRCDALLVMTGDTPSDGTWREMAYAEKLEIPVIMVAPRRAHGELVGWSNVEVPYIVEDIKSAIRLIKRKFVKEYEKHKNYFDSCIRKAKKPL